MSESPLTLSQSWLETRLRAPQAIAVIEAASGRVYTREELQAEVDAWLTTAGDCKALMGRRVGLALPNGIAWFSVFLGLLQAGAIPVLLDSSETQERLAKQAASLGCAFLWTGIGLLALAGRARKGGADHCLVKVTSGSTGEPKGLLFTHSQMVADGRQVCSSMGIQEADTNFALIPLGHSYGLGSLVVPLLLQGTPVLCGSMPLPGCIAAECAKWKPSVFPAVPVLLRALLRSDLGAGALSALRLVVSAGSPLDAGDARDFVSKFSLRVHSFYGSSETGGICYDREGEAALSGRSVGAPLDGVTLRFVRGGRFEVSSAAVQEKGTFSPADKGCLNELGELVLTGRVGRVFKMGGRRLDLAGLEAEIATVLGARGVVVVVHPERPEALAALVACDLVVRDARAKLVEQLAAWKVPARLRTVLELPCTERGKIDRAKAAEMLAQT